VSNVGQVAVIPGARGIMPYLICKVTGSHSHHMIVITGENECVSADPGGVSIRRLSDFPTAVVSKFVLTGEQAAQVAAFAKAQSGKPYAFLDDALIAVERVFRFRFPGWVRERFADDGQWQCAELADAALAAAGVNVFHDGRMIGDVYPGSYEAEFINRGWYTLKYFRTFPLLPW
jgi:uncharacterized protein YycO